MTIGIHPCLLIIITVFCSHCESLCLPICEGNFVCSGSTCVCNDGYYGVNCTDTCEDSGGGSCQNGGTCGSTSPKSCTCVSGYTGTLCETESNVVNNTPVQNHPCSTTTTTTTAVSTTGVPTSSNNTGSISKCLLNPLNSFIIFVLLYKILKYRTPNFV